MKIFSLIFLLAFFSVSNLHAYDQDTAKAKIEIGKKVNDAQNLARNKKYGKAIKMLELISQELESRPKLKPHFNYLPSLIVSYNKKISELERKNAKKEIDKKVKDAQKLARNKNYGEAIKMVELISQELESRPFLKPLFTNLPSLIVSYNKKISELERKTAALVCKQAMPKRSRRCGSIIKFINKPISQYSSFGHGVPKEIDVGLKLFKTCNEEHQGWLSELDSNLEAKGVKLDSSEQECVALKKTKNEYINTNPFHERTRIRFVCHMKYFEWERRVNKFSPPNLALMELLAPGQKYQNLTPGERGKLKNTRTYFKKVIRLGREQIQKFDQDMKEWELDFSSCPRPFQVRALYVKNLDNTKAADKKNTDNRKKKEEQQVAETARFNAAIEALYKSGLFKKFTTDDLKEEEEDRKSSMVKAGLNYQAWLKFNKKFETSHYYKNEILGTWKQVYINYMVTNFCEKNQGKFALIEDKLELKNKMKVINMMLPLQIDPDVLWATAEGSNIMKQLYKVDGVLSAEKFALKFGKNCETMQRLVRLLYNDFTKTLAEKKRKKTKRNF